MYGSAKPGSNLLRDNRSPEDLYRQIGQAFIDLSAVKDAKPPRWSRRPEILERLASGKDISHFEIPKEDLEEIDIAREVVSKIQELQGRLPKDATPAQEMSLASEPGTWRAIFQIGSKPLPHWLSWSLKIASGGNAFSALRPDESPIRFAYYRFAQRRSPPSDCLSHRTITAQYLRFAVSHEHRVRLGALLNEIHSILNSPSPDPYRLRLLKPL